MWWSTKGTHLFLQIRKKMHDVELKEKFNHWYSGFQKNPEVAEMTA